MARLDDGLQRFERAGADSVFISTANGWGGAIWQSGRGPSVDSAGNIYVVAANGDSDNVTDFSDAVLKLSPANLTIQDWFAPSDQQSIDEDDEDLGSAGAIPIPGTSLLITGGKQGTLYLLNTASLGHISPNNGQILQSLPGSGSGVFNMAVWNRATGPMIYMLGANTSLGEFQLAENAIDTTPVSQTSTAFGVPYQGMTISANGGQPGTGIVWFADADSWPFPAPGTLHAFDADDLSTELWNSDMNATDQLGGFSKFTNPTVINGKVYMASASNRLLVYGILPPPAPAPVITGLVNGASYVSGPLAPGEIVTIFGQNLGPQTMANGTYDQNGNLNAELDGTQATFNGVAAPLLYVSAGAISAVVPFEVAGSNQAVVEVTVNGQPSASGTYPVAPTVPGIFTCNASGSGEAVIFNQDGSANGANNPAAPGSVIVVYATGAGVTNPADADGSIAQAGNPLAAMSATTATIGTKAATVVYAGDVPGEVAGMAQFKVQVPKGVAGSVPVVVNVGGSASQANATVMIAGPGQTRTSFSRRVPRVP